MYNREIKPPQSLKDILPELATDIKQREIERQRNLRANEVFLQADSLLQFEQTKVPRKITSLFKRQPDKYRSLPAVPFEYEGQKIRIQLKDRVEIGKHGNTWKDGISIVVSIGDVGPEELELFHLEKQREHWNPVLKMGNRYSITDRHDAEATIEEIETVAGILTFIQEALKTLPTPQ